MTCVFQVPSDPDRQITIILHDLTVRVRRELESLSYDIDENTSVSGLIRRLRTDYTKSMHFSLKVDGKAVPNRNLIELFHDLNAAFTLT
jgi:hypothetical protein